jgi:hypothetical protein
MDKQIAAKEAKAMNPYRRSESSAAMILAELSQSSDDEIPESAKKRQTKDDMEDEDYTPQKGVLQQALEESKEKEKKNKAVASSWENVALQALSASGDHPKCMHSWCKRPTMPGKPYCDKVGHQHRLDKRGNRLCSTPGCDSPTFDIHTDKCGDHDTSESRRKAAVVSIEEVKDKNHNNPMEIEELPKDDTAASYTPHGHLKIREYKIPVLGKFFLCNALSFCLLIYLCFFF